MARIFLASLATQAACLQPGLSTIPRHGRLTSGVGRTGAASMNIVSTARLLFSDLVLKAQMQLDPEMELWKLPARDLIRSEEDIYTVAGAFPESVRAQFLDWYEGYKVQVTAPQPHGPGLSEEELVVIFNRIIDRLILMKKQKFNFASRHEGIIEPYDYFEFGQEYVKPLIDFDKSWVRNPELWEEASAAVKRGENVVLLANHQSEADAAFLPLFFPEDETLARDVYYVAGGRVVGDPLAQPFSMGRNLFCVHSKKYIDIETDAAQKKQMNTQNRRTLTELSRAMKTGGVMIWLAPSGGRDRLTETEPRRPKPAGFDSAAVEMFRSIGEKSGKPTHLYPMAMATYSIMPPPDGRNKALGEKRVTKYTGIAVSLAPEVDTSDGAAWRPAPTGDAKADKELAAEAITQHLFEQVCAEYDVLEPVMADFEEPGYVPPNSAKPWVKA